MAQAVAEDRRYLLVSLTLAFVGGFADAGSFVLVNSFTGHITGNSILLAIHLVNSQWLQALSCLVAVIAFLAGTAGGVMWPHPPGRSTCRRLAPVLLLEIVLIALGMIVPVLPTRGHSVGCHVDNANGERSRNRSFLASHLSGCFHLLSKPFS